MKTKYLVPMVAILCATQIYADDITTLDGKSYQNVTVSRVEPDGLVLVTSDGIEKLPFTNLSEEVRKKYGYNPKQAAQYQQSVYQANLRAAEAKAATLEAAKKQADKNAYIKEHTATVVVSIREVRKDGAIVDPKRKAGCASDMANDLIFIEGINGVAEGEELQVDVYRDDIYNWKGHQLQKWICIRSSKTITFPDPDAPQRPVSHLQSIGGG